MTFGGFPARSKATAIPNVFFTDVLPHLGGDASTIGVVLYAFHALMERKGFPRYVSAADLRADPSVATFLAQANGGEGALERGLSAACDAGVLLPLRVESEGCVRDLYFLNAPADRRGLDAVRSGAVPLGRVVPAEAAQAERPGVFALYESLIGTLSPLVADELAEAERAYPAEWLEEAFREAAAQNARSWRYVSRILERWANEGRSDAKTGRDPAAGDRYFAGKYGRILRQRLQP